MLEILRRFLFDEAYAMGWFKMLAFGCGFLFSQGVLTLDSLGAEFGPVGKALGYVLVITTVGLLPKDKTPEVVKNLSYGDMEALQRLLRSVGAPPLTPEQHKKDVNGHSKKATPNE